MEAQAVLDMLMEEEEEMLFGREERKHLLEILLWTMDQADLKIPAWALKWAAFMSLTTTPLAPVKGPRKVVLALPSPGLIHALIVIKEEAMPPMMVK